MIICPRSCCHIIQHVWATRSQTEFAPSPWEGIRGGHEELKREPVKKFVSCIWVSNEEGRFLQAETDLIPWINYSLKIIHPTSINRVSLCFFGEKKPPMIFHKSQKGNIRDIIYTQTEWIIHRVLKEIFPIKWCFILSRSQIFRRAQHPATPAESSSLLKI